MTRRDDEFTIHRLTAAEVPLLRDWADGEKWNPGTHDAPAFFATDPDGFFVGCLGDLPVASVSCVRYGENAAFLGIYIVRPEHRGKGFGLRVWQAGMAHVAGRVVGLDGVLAQVPNYEASGFRFAHHQLRFAGTGGGETPAGLTPLADVPFPKLADYDERCFFARREVFLRQWLKLPESVGRAIVNDGEIRGYGLLRRSADGHKIGPLFADDETIAAELLAGLVATIPGQPFCIDIPEATVQPGADHLIRRFSMTEVFRTARMYNGPIPTFDIKRVYGVTTLELG
ncbi:GNAT family N-acetyltransferase [Zavarzinella formosa]|uniref:GNAT family N-acetyltransferase n=1 Tax=Zavarzinella formosa TaxID=360055 RepID=UPI0002E98819|nr:GNAT family N-acetyltransferase [Zavarzinella formosa]